jgi:hypothetical protein
MNDNKDTQEDRADRLSRRRRERSRSTNTEQARDTSNSLNTDNAGKSSDSDNADNAADTTETIAALRDTAESRMMRLTAEQNDELQFVYTQLKSAYEYEYDNSFELNRHFYPLMLAHALPELRELDAEQVRAELNDLNMPTDE